MPDSDWLHETAASYDAVAVPFTAYTRGWAEKAPIDRHILDAFAELATTGRSGVVLDAGCGSGWITGHLHSRGLDVTGIDLSPSLIEIARRNHPEVRFEVGSLTDLPVVPGSLDGIVCWYVLHHIPDAFVGTVFDQFTAALSDGGHLVLGGHVGDETHTKTQGYGGVPMNVLVARRPLDAVVGLLRERGFTVDMAASMYPDGAIPAFLVLARKGDGSA